ncbi:MAG: hypothetical protein J6N20_15195 [Pseudomonas sp.]|nr:hypothetical protein [Pseudomonas sp.]
MSREQFEKEYGENHGKGVIDPAKPWFVLVQKKAAPAKWQNLLKLVGKMVVRFGLVIGIVLLAVYFICGIAGVAITMYELATGTRVKS